MALTDPQTLIGQQIAQYTIQKHIARGGMADVYLAQDIDLQRPVALKIMLAALSADQEFVARFHREARTVAKLDHPNIIQVYNIGLTPGGQPYLAMQYIDGGSLRDVLRELGQRGKLMPTAQVLSIMRQMADALRVAHQAGIVHRDIKPNNILLRNDGTPMLVDLGIAAVQSGPKLTRTGSLIGTPHYMAPEQARGEPADDRSDIYSLGVVLYEMLTGRPPFTAEEPMAVLHAHVYEQPHPIGQLRRDLSPKTQQLVEICLQKNANQRFQTAVEMLQFIDQALAAEGAGGQVSSSGVWRPQPGGTTPISQGRVLRPVTEERKQVGEKRPFQWWWAALPVLLVVLGLAVWQFGFADGDDGATPLPTRNQPTTGVDVVVVEEATSTLQAVSTPIPTFTPLPTLTPLPPATATATPRPTDTPQATVTPDRGPEQAVIGHSVQNRPIEAVRFGSGPNVVIFIGGLHAGFAPATVSLAQSAIDYYTTNLSEIPDTVTLYIIPNANPDSPYDPGNLSGRLNANDVDINRNWDCDWTQNAKWRGNTVPGSGGTGPFSEPETRVLRDFIVEKNPKAVVFWEARATNGLSSPGACGSRSLVSASLSQSYGLAAGYQVADFENLTNQELNGDGTNWLDSQRFPAIAVLLPEYTSEDWFANLAGMRAVLQANR
ncbi:MAG: protein kinase [Anaerolineales bacterium]|nr:protein kinase [Anaerolineales bacterium]MCB8990442.1 protein kinase [Ardenticatenaceae bacterium]MCB9003456.1 protein kinase [Ardenticatenaceae bacterium]